MVKNELEHVACRCRLLLRPPCVAQFFFFFFNLSHARTAVAAFSPACSADIFHDIHFARGARRGVYSGSARSWRVIFPPAQPHPAMLFPLLCGENNGAMLIVPIASRRQALTAVHVPKTLFIFASPLYEQHCSL